MDQEDSAFSQNEDSELLETQEESGEDLALEDIETLRTEVEKLELNLPNGGVQCDNIENAAATGDHTRKHPYDLIFQEMWMKIFEWLTDPDDLTNCMNACATFHTLLKEKRTMFLFSQVFRIIAENIAEKKQDHVDMLVCRGVSKSWKQDVDNLYQNLPFLSKLDYYAFHEEMLKCISAFLCRLWNDPFSIEFELSPRGLPELKRKSLLWSGSCVENNTNPFPSRHLAIYDSEDTLRDDQEGLFDNAEAKRRITEILEVFGHHVWYLTILLHMGVPAQRYLLLLQWLNHVPNLKALSIYFRPGDGDFEDTVDNHPFPEKSQLSVLQGDKVPNVLLKSILKANPQIERVQNQGAPSQTPFSQPKLSENRVHITTEISQIDMNTAKYSKLEKLSIDFHVAADEPTHYRCYTIYSCKCSLDEGYPCMEIQLWRRSPADKAVVFTMLERFEGTLVHFRLGLLETSLKVHNGPFSLHSLCVDLILPLRAWNLKSLQVSAKCRDGYRWIDKKDVTSQLYTYLDGRLQESKIWKLPEVKQVFVVDGCDGNLTLFV